MKESRGNRAGPSKKQQRRADSSDKDSTYEPPGQVRRGLRSTRRATSPPGPIRVNEVMPIVELDDLFKGGLGVDPVKKKEPEDPADDQYETPNSSFSLFETADFSTLQVQSNPIPPNFSSSDSDVQIVGEVMHTPPQQEPEESSSRRGQSSTRRGRGRPPGSRGGNKVAASKAQQNGVDEVDENVEDTVENDMQPPSTQPQRRGGRRKVTVDVQDEDEQVVVAHSSADQSDDPSTSDTLGRGRRKKVVKMPKDADDDLSTSPLKAALTPRKIVDDNKKKDVGLTPVRGRPRKNPVADKVVAASSADDDDEKVNSAPNSPVPRRRGRKKAVEAPMEGDTENSSDEENERVDKAPASPTRRGPTRSTRRRGPAVAEKRVDEGGETEDGQRMEDIPPMSPQSPQSRGRGGRRGRGRGKRGRGGGLLNQERMIPVNNDEEGSDFESGLNISSRMIMRSAESEDSADSGDEERTATVKKTKLMVGTRTLDQKQHINLLTGNIAEALQLAYRSKQEEKDLQYGKMMLLGTLTKMMKFREEETPIVYRKYFDHLLRKADEILANVFVDDFYMEGRYRMYKVLSLSIVASVMEKKDPDSIYLNHFANITFKYSLAVNSNVRLNIIAFISFCLLLSHTYGQMEPGKWEEGNVLPGQLRRKWLDILKRHGSDKVAAVRLEVVRALSFLQDHPVPADFTESPKEALVNHLFDVSHDVRHAVVRSLSILDDDHVAAIVDVARYDKNPKVRRAALMRLANVNYTSIVEEHRIEVLTATLQDTNPFIRDAATNHLLPGWLKQAMDPKTTEMRRKGKVFHVVRIDERIILNCDGMAQGVVELLRGFDVLHNTKACRLVVAAVFRCQRRLLGLQDEPLQSFVRDLINGCKKEDHFIYAHTINKLINRQLDNLLQAEMAFTWRALVDFCCKYAQDEADRYGCVDRLCPPMLAVTEMLKKFLDWRPVEGVDQSDELGFFEFHEFRRFSIRELLGVLRQLDRTDSYAMEAWKQLLVHMMTMRDCPPYKEVVDQVVQDVSEVFYPNNHQVCFDDLCGYIATLVSEYQHDGVLVQTNADGRPLDVSERTTGGGEVGEKEKDDKIPPTALFRVILIFNSMCKATLIRKVDSYVKQVYCQYIVKVFDLEATHLPPSDFTLVRSWACEILGILCLYSSRFTRLQSPFLTELFELDTSQVRVSILKALTDLAIVCRYDFVNEMLKNNVPASYRNVQYMNGEMGEFNLIYLLELGLADVNCDLVITASECACKLLFNETKPEWVSVLSFLVMRLFQTTLFGQMHYKSMLGQFFPIFASIKRENQNMLVECLKIMIRQPLDDVDSERACIYLTYLTSYAILSDTAIGKAEGSVQPYLCQTILEDLESRPDGAHALQLTKCCSVINLDGFSEAEIEKCMNDAIERAEMLEDFHAGNPGRVNKYSSNLKVFIRNCEKRLLRMRRDGTSQESEQQRLGETEGNGEDADREREGGPGSVEPTMQELMEQGMGFRPESPFNHLVQLRTNDRAPGHPAEGNRQQEDAEAADDDQASSSTRRILNPKKRLMGKYEKQQQQEAEAAARRAVEERQAVVDLVMDADIDNREIERVRQDEEAEKERRQLAEMNIEGGMGEREEETTDTRQTRTKRTASKRKL